MQTYVFLFYKINSLKQKSLDGSFQCEAESKTEAENLLFKLHPWVLDKNNILSVDDWVSYEELDGHIKSYILN